MDLIHKVMNILLPPITLILLIFLLPILLAFWLLRSIKRSISSENVAGKVVLVTGAASGIGEQLAYEYGRRGAFLVLVDISEDNLVKVRSKAISVGSPDAISIVADVSKVDDCKRFINQAVNHFGRLDHLVNNAGIYRDVMFKDVTQISNIIPVMDVNFWGTVYSTHFAIPHLLKSRGKIVVVASTCGWYPLPRLVIYNASKAALISFCETLRAELGWDIGITIVTPGSIRTKMSRGTDLLRLIPAESAEGCAKAIVKSACRGDMYLTEPSWIRVLFPLKIFCPEIIDLCNHWLFLMMRTNKSYSSKINVNSAAEFTSLQSDPSSSLNNVLVESFLELGFMLKFPPHKLMQCNFSVQFHDLESC